jgi:hypothetical protein
MYYELDSSRWNLVIPKSATELGRVIMRTKKNFENDKKFKVRSHPIVYFKYIS